MEFIDRINELCKERKISKRQLEREAGLGAGSSSKWKQFTPNNTTMTKLANYFGISISYLTSEFFGLMVKGDSMSPRIEAGDVLIVKQQSDADSGDVVIAQANGDSACVKKLLKQDDGIVLQSFNPAYAPMYFSNKDIIEKPVQIIGKVIENRQKF